MKMVMGFVIFYKYQTWKVENVQNFGIYFYQTLVIALLSDIFPINNSPNKKKLQTKYDYKRL